MSKSTCQVITPQRHFFDFQWRQCWQRRQLLGALVARDLQVRYKNTFLGVAWAIIQPLLSTLIFTLIFTKLVKFTNSHHNYLIYTLIGFIFWQFCYNSLAAASTSVYEQIGMVRKIYFPRIFLPLTVVLRCLVDLLITLTVLLAALYWQHLSLTPMAIFGFALAVLTLTIFITSMSFLLAALNARWRDFRLLLPFILQIWFYATPVFYQSELLADNLAWLIYLNPLSHFLIFARAAILEGELLWQWWWPSLLISSLLFMINTGIFKRLETQIVDIA